MSIDTAPYLLKGERPETEVRCKDHHFMRANLGEDALVWLAYEPSLDNTEGG